MAMDETAWARHANPLSFYTRIPILPLAALAIHARVVIGWWCLVHLFAHAVSTFLNPRVFPPPERRDSYAARGVLGERLFLARARNPIPRRHSVAAHVLTGVSAAGVPILVYGLVALEPFATLAGLVLVVGAKLWFVDRMVWLHDEMARAGRTAAPNTPP